MGVPAKDIVQAARAEGFRVEMYGRDNDELGDLHVGFIGLRRLREVVWARLAWEHLLCKI